MKNDQLMNNERVKQLIDTYGSNPEAWPANERVAATVLLNNSPELLDLQHSAIELDKYFNLDKNASTITAEHAATLTNKVVESVNTFNRKPHWIMDLLQHFVQPHYAIVFSVLLATIIVVFFQTLSPQNEVKLANAEFDRWMLAQVTGVTSEEDIPVEIGFMELVELEVDADSSI